MTDYISRQAAIKKLEHDPIGKLLIDKYNVRGWLEGLPAADVRKNIKAQKVLAGGILDGTTHWYECSCCHGAVDMLDAYCKHCGAVLELENDL